MKYHTKLSEIKYARMKIHKHAYHSLYNILNYNQKLVEMPKSRSEIKPKFTETMNFSIYLFKKSTKFLKSMTKYMKKYTKKIK